MKQTLFLLGPPDREAQYSATEQRIEGSGSIMTADVSGVLPIMDYVMSDRMMSAKSHMVLVGVHNIQLSSNAQVNLFNLVGDADASGTMLHTIQNIANRVQPLRLFNPPSCVYRTSRARLPNTLANIPGCIVPRVEAVAPKTFSELRTVCKEFSSWPLIVRARGYHGGQHMQLLADETQLECLEHLSWPYSGILLIQFVDTRIEEGLYQKIRVIVVDGVPYLRHCIYSDHWAIHAGSRADLMDQDAELCRREEYFLAQLRDRGLREYGSIFQEIYRRTGLDVFGIDFTLLNDQLVVFEANPCMSFLGDRKRANTQYEFLDSYIKDLRRAIKKMLVRA